MPRTRRRPRSDGAGGRHAPRSAYREEWAPHAARAVSPSRVRPARWLRGRERRRPTGWHMRESFLSSGGRILFARMDDRLRGELRPAGIAWIFFQRDTAFEPATSTLGNGNLSVSARRGSLRNLRKMGVRRYRTVHSLRRDSKRAAPDWRKE